MVVYKLTLASQFSNILINLIFPVAAEKHEHFHYALKKEEEKNSGHILRKINQIYITIHLFKFCLQWSNHSTLSCKNLHIQDKLKGSWFLDSR